LSLKINQTNNNMEKCTNCQRSLSCSCQKRVATNGMQCCAACLQEYEKRVRDEKRLQEEIKNRKL